MEEELVTNTITSVYCKKPRLLSSFHRNNQKAFTNYRPKMSNLLKSVKINDISNETAKQNKNNIKSISQNKNNYRYNLRTLNNEIKPFFSDEKTLIESKPKLNENETSNFKIKQRELIRKDKNVYLLRKVYIILPNDNKKMYNDFNKKRLQFNCYFPTEIKSKRIIDYIDSAQSGDIICKNLKDIYSEVYKYLKLSKDYFVKLEIYDEKLRPIKLESQLFINKKRIVYIKITYIDEEEVNSVKNRIKSRDFFSHYLYLKKINHEKNKLDFVHNDVSTGINNEEAKNKNNIKTYQTKTMATIPKKEDYNSNYFYQETDNSTKFNTISQMGERNNLRDRLRTNESKEKKQKIIISPERKSLNIITNKRPFILEDIPYKNDYLKTYNKTSDLINANDDEEKGKKTERYLFRTKKNNFLNIIKNNGYKSNNLISPFLFKFDTTDIINNKYVLNYLSNKNKIEKQENKFQIKNKFEIKTLNIEDSNSKREKRTSIIKNIKANLINKSRNENINVENLTIAKNKRTLIELNFKIREFIEKNIDSLITDEEIKDFKYLTCNYVLINELKKFPLLKLKKEFLFFVYLSQKMISKYEEIFTYRKSDNNFLNNILKLEQFENSLNYLNRTFNDIIMKKNFLFGYLRMHNININIPFFFFLLFIFYNKHLIEQNPKNSLIYISFECIDISNNLEINFQQFCNYKLMMTKNSFISYNKKFNFIKDLILRVFLAKRFNTKKSIKILETIFKDININKIKKILNTDMCLVKLKKNIEIYNDVDDLFDQFINYIEI